MDEDGNLQISNSNYNGEEEADPENNTMNQPLLKRHRTLSSTPLALVGTKVSHIESLDYEINENDLFKHDWRSRSKAQVLQYIFAKWTLAFLVGLLTGLIATLINLAVENIAGYKLLAVGHYIAQDRFVTGLLVFTGANLGLTLVATVLVVVFAPTAAGPGIPEIKAYLNGIDTPNMFGATTMIVKIVGSIGAVAAGLDLGKEGPLVHIGSCIASLLGQGGPDNHRIKWRWLRYFNNDRDRRDLITCGSASGVCAAFRSPVGGVLFALEEVATWWRSALLWRTFFSTAVVVVVLRAFIEICNSGKCGLFGKGGLIMFDVSHVEVRYHAVDIIPVTLIGVIGGILGSLYNHLLHKVLRLYNLINQKGKIHKVLLSLSVSLFTSLCLYGLPFLAECKPCNPSIDEACPTNGRSGNFKQFNCPNGYYNDLATLFLTTNDDAVRNVFSSNTPNEFDQILQKELDALTYRVLAYLLLGLVRIYSKKVDFLFHDCNTAFIAVKEFVAKDKNNRDNTNVPLPASASSTVFSSIALPQCFELDAFDLGVLEDSHGDNVRPQEDITLKQDGGTGRDTESMDHYYMERFDMEEEEDLGFTFHETFVADHTDTRFETAHDMDIDAENVRDASGEASIRVVEAEPLESNKSSIDQQNASRYGKDPESDDMEREEPGSVGGNGDLPECIEKHRGYSDGEMTDTNMFHKEPSEPPEVNKVGYNEKGFLSDMTFSEDPESKGSSAKDTPVAATPKTPSRLKISQGTGETSHQFSIITTPSGKESSRKRKCLIDDEVIIPNKVIKKMIDDSSTLVKKRRRVPDIDYPERRIKRLADPSRSYWDPLFPYGSLDLHLLFNQPIRLKEQNTTETPKAAKTYRQMKRSSLRNRGDVFPVEQTENGREIMETPQAAALAELKITVPETVSVSSIAAGSSHQTKVASETPIEPSESTYIAPDTPARTSEQTGIAPETPAVSEREEIAPEMPVRESMSKGYFKDPETCEQETRPANSFTFFDECPSEYFEDRRDLDVILMNEEVNAHETEDLQQETWSARTRNVAKFLEKTFLEQKEKGEEEKASLLQLCRGRTQKESARLFYETLVLKTKGYLEVKQDHQYNDILLSPITRQQEAC